MKTSTNKIKELEIKIQELESIIQDSTRQLEELKECLKTVNTLEYPKIFETKEDLVNWLNENGVKYKSCYIYKNGDWKYKDIKGFWHLYRNGVELTKGIKAKWAYSYDNGYWSYGDTENFEHLFRNGEELTKGIKAKWVYSYDNGDWKCEDENGCRHEFDKDNNPI